MIHPVVHVNGTPREVLFRQLGGAAQALRGALIDMRSAQPNGRDYYPLGGHAINEAGLDHQARLKAVAGVLAEYEQMLERVVGTTEESR